MAKISCWFVIVVLMFFVPNGLIRFYETFAKLALDCFFWFRLCFCWTLFMDGLRTGLHRMNNFGVQHCC
jgi:hypothetical protein